jgi:hypothetical protein
MKRMFKYYISGLLCIVCLLTSVAQEGRIKGIRIGYDLTKPAFYYFEPERKAFEVSVDFEVKQNYYTTLEYGQQKVDLIEPGFNYTLDGYYSRIGLDYNFSKKKMEVDHYEMVFGGFRYGYAKYSQTARNIVLTENYWGVQTIGDLSVNDLSAHWFEVVAGIRGELFKNFFMGWSFRGRVMIWKKKDPFMYAYNIPGFGIGNKKAQLGFNYSIYYRIHLYKTKNKPSPEQAK